MATATKSWVAVGCLFARGKYHHGGMFICPQTARLLRTFLLEHSSNCLQQEGVIKHMMTTMMITIAEMMMIYHSF